MAGEATGNWFSDSLSAIAGFATVAVDTASTFIERKAAAKVATTNAKTAAAQVVTNPIDNTAASTEAALKAWATFAAISGSLLFVALLVLRKRK